MGWSDRLLARIFHGPDRCYDRPLAIDGSVVGSPLDMRAKSPTARSELAEANGGGKRAELLPGFNVHR